MDRELMPSVSKRIRSTDKRLGPREEMKAKSEPGFKIYVTNLHHKVTQEDIVVSTRSSINSSRSTCNKIEMINDYKRSNRNYLEMLGRL